MGWLLHTHKFFTSPDFGTTSAVAHPTLPQLRSPRCAQLSFHQIVWRKLVSILTVGLYGVTRHKVVSAQGVFPGSHSFEMNWVNARTPTTQVVAMHRVGQISVYEQLIHNTAAYFIKASFAFYRWTKVARSYVDIGIPRFCSTSCPVPTGGIIV